MERLTIKVPNDEHYRTLDTKFIQSKEIDKLGQLEDIEEELGIELSVLFKAMNSKQLYGHFFDWCRNCYDKEIRKIRNARLDIHKKILIVDGYGGVYNQEVKLKDYGKTWALTKEELEK